MSVPWMSDNRLSVTDGHSLCNRVWSRCIRLGLPWEELGFVEPGV